MSQDKPNRLTSAPHFMQIAAGHHDLADAALFEVELRRIGLRPLPVADTSGGAGATAHRAVWLIHFGALTAMADWVSINPPDSGEGFGVRLRPVQALTTNDPVAESRELFKLAVLLIDMAVGQQFYWSPADLWTRADAFRAAVTEMLASGMPPVLHLVAFDNDADAGTTKTRGLAHFCGQELMLEASGGLDRVARMRRLVRLAVDMMLNGRISARRRFAGLAPGEFIEAVPDLSTPADVQRVRVRIDGP